jgi:hypothetical protein
VHTVREALEALHHSHWDGMDFASTLAEVPTVELRPSDLPPPRTEALQREHLLCPMAMGPPTRTRSMGGRVRSEVGGGGGDGGGDGGGSRVKGLAKSASIGAERFHQEQQHQHQQQRPPLVPPAGGNPPPQAPQGQEQEPQQLPRRARSQSVGAPPQRAHSLRGRQLSQLSHGDGWATSLSAGASPSHHEMLASAHRLLREAHEAHESHVAAQQWRELQALGVSVSGLKGSNGSLTSLAPGPAAAPSPAPAEGEVATAATEASMAFIPRVPTPPLPVLAASPSITITGLPPSFVPPPPPSTQHHQGNGPLLLDSVVRKLQGARDTLTQLLDVATRPLPRGGLRGHVVLGLCNDAAPSPEDFIQVRPCACACAERRI